MARIACRLATLVTGAGAVFPARAAVATVGDFAVPAPVRIARAVASAAIVRDTAAFVALVVLFTMFATLAGVDAGV